MNLDITDEAAAFAEDELEEPVVSMIQLRSILEALLPFAGACAKGSEAHMMVQHLTDQLREKKVTTLSYPAAGVAISIAQSNVSWRDWENLLDVYERLRAEVARRIKPESKASAIVETADG